MTKGLAQSIYNKILDDLGLDNADLQLNYLNTKNLNFTYWRIEEESTSAIKRRSIALGV